MVMPALSMEMRMLPGSITKGMIHSSSIYNEAKTVESTSPFILNKPWMTSAESIFSQWSPAGTLMKSILPSSKDTEEMPSILYFLEQEAKRTAQNRKK